jgi:hypothetical protein
MRPPASIILPYSSLGMLHIMPATSWKVRPSQNAILMVVVDVAADLEHA